MIENQERKHVYSDERKWHSGGKWHWRNLNIALLVILFTCLSLVLFLWYAGTLGTVFWGFIFLWR